MNTTRSLTISSRQARVSGEGSPATEGWSYKGDEHRRGNTLPSPANFLKFSTPPPASQIFCPSWETVEGPRICEKFQHQLSKRSEGRGNVPPAPFAYRLISPLRPYKQPVKPPQKVLQKAKKGAFFRAFSKPSGGLIRAISTCLKLTTLSTDCFDQQQQPNAYRRSSAQRVGRAESLRLLRGKPAAPIHTGFFPNRGKFRVGGLRAIRPVSGMGLAGSEVPRHESGQGGVY